MATQAELDALRGRTSQLLMSAACQRIDFHWGRNHIDGSAFSFIALTLITKPKAQHGISFVVKPQPPNVGASYDPGSNRVEFPTASFGSSDPWEKMSIIHEMTHAVIDLKMKRNSLRAVHDEICAYTAGALFNIYSAANPAAGPYPYVAAPSTIYSAAHDVARAIQGSPGTAINPTTVNPLRLAILASPTYTYLHAHPNYAYGNNGVSL